MKRKRKRKMEQVGWLLQIDTTTGVHHLEFESERRAYEALLDIRRNGLPAYKFDCCEEHADAIPPGKVLSSFLIGPVPFRKAA